MSEADKLFEELGYNSFEGLRTIDYFLDEFNSFQFQKSSKKVFIRKDEMADFISMQELKAINMKVKELRLGGIK